MANNVLKEELVLNSGQFDNNINNVIKKVEELKTKGKTVGDGFNGSMSKMIERATGFNGSMGSLISIVGKFGGALGIAMSAGEAFNKVINSSQTLADEFGATQQGVTTIVDNFFQSLANGDFSPFLNGMDNIVSKAREAFNAMDDLWNMAQSFSVQNARLNNKFQQNLNEIRTKKDSKDPKDKKRVKELTEENKRIIGQQAKGGIKLYNQTISGLQSEIAAGTGMNTKITEGAIYRIVENDINNLKGGRKRYAKEYKEYLANVEEMNKQADRNKGRYFMGKTGVNYQNDLKKLQKQYGESIAANYLLQRKSDEELEEFNNKLKQGIQYQGVAISNQSKMLRYTKETNNSASGGRSGRGGKTTKGGNTSTFPVGSVGYYEKLIADLQKQIKLQVDSSEIIRLQNEIKKAKIQLDNLLNPKREIKIDTSNLGSLIKNKDNSNLQSEAKNLNIKIPSIFEQYNDLTNQIDSVLDAYDIGGIGAEKAQELIDSINSQIATLGLKPIKVHLETDTEKFLSSLETGADSLLSSFNGIDGVIGDITSLSQAISEGANGWEVFMGVLQTGVGIIQTVSTVLNTLNTLQELFGTTSLVAAEQNAAAGASEMATAAGVTAAKSGEAIAGATASGAKMPFPLNLIAIAAGVAAVVAALATITGAFANGGVVGGSQYAGDALLARVNSGEMILNGSQQKNLFDLIDRGGSNGGVGGNVNFVIRGKDLHGVLSNYDDKMKKVR